MRELARVICICGDKSREEISSLHRQLRCSSREIRYRRGPLYVWINGPQSFVCDNGGIYIFDFYKLFICTYILDDINKIIKFAYTECQTRCDISGTELGRDVQRLRSMLDAFPRFAERGLVAGPDVVTFKTRQQQQYLQDYFAAASSSLSAVTWHP